MAKLTLLFFLENINKLRLIIMVNIRNIKGNYLFFQIRIWKSFGYFSSLEIFHYKNKVCPGKLIFRKRFICIKSGRFCIEFILKNLSCCFASVLVLVAYKQYIYDNFDESFNNLNLLVKPWLF